MRVVGASIHLDDALRSKDAHFLQGTGQGFSFQRTRKLGGLGEGLNANPGGLAEVGQNPVARRPQAGNARLVHQTLQQLAVFGRIKRHEIGVARIKTRTHLGREMGDHGLVVMAHDHRHVRFKSAFGEAGQQSHLVCAGKVGDKNIGTGARHLVEQRLDGVARAAYRQIFLADDFAVQTAQRVHGSMDGAARPFVVVAGKEHLRTIAPCHEGNHFVDLLIGQGGKVEEVRVENAAFVEREIEVGNAFRFCDLGGHGNARV